MRDVVLGGDLALRFGDRFRLDVASPAEAAHALCKLLDGFQAAFVGRDRQRRKLWTLIRTILHVTARAVHRARRVAVIRDHHHGQAPFLGHIGDRINRGFLTRIIGPQAAVDMEIRGVPTGRGRIF